MANLQEMGLLVPQKAVGSGIGKRPTHSSRRALRHDLKCGRPARDGIGVTAVSLLLQVEAQCVVELGITSAGAGPRTAPSRSTAMERTCSAWALES